MPHLILEYSANVGKASVGETTEFGPLLSQLHGVLSETAGIDVRNCKSRARGADEYLVSEGGDLDAFVHLDIRFLDGRPVDLKRAVGSRCLDVLREWFADPASALTLQITVEVHDIDRDTYFKYPEGTLSPLPNTTSVSGKTAPD